MCDYNMKIQIFKTGEDKPIMPTLIFNLDTIKEVREFKEQVIEAHRQVVNNPENQIEIVSIIASG